MGLRGLWGVGEFGGASQSTGSVNWVGGRALFVCGPLVGVVAGGKVRRRWGRSWRRWRAAGGPYHNGRRKKSKKEIEARSEERGQQLNNSPLALASIENRPRSTDRSMHAVRASPCLSIDLSVDQFDSIWEIDGARPLSNRLPSIAQSCITRNTRVGDGMTTTPPPHDH